MREIALDFLAFSYIAAQGNWLFLLIIIMSNFPQMRFYLSAIFLTVWQIVKVL